MARKRLGSESDSCKMISTLVKKDYRLLRGNIWLIVLVATAPYLLMYFTMMPAMRGEMSQMKLLVEVLANGSRIALVMSIPTIAMLAGCCFTLERSDRSAEFLACLPPLRIHVLIAKAIVLLAVLVILLTAKAAIAYLAFELSLRSGAGYQTISITEFTPYVKVILCVAGIGWAASSVSPNTLLPTLLALLSPVLVMSFMMTLDYALGASFTGDGRVIELTEEAMLLFGVLGFALGSFWFLNRREYV